MRRVVVVPFASTLHGREYYLSIYEALRRLLKPYAGIEITQVVTEKDDVTAIAKNYRDAIPILVALTGGVSRVIRRFANEAGYLRVVLFGHGEHNSLPSAISAKVKLEMDGMWTWIYSCKDINDPGCRTVIDEMMRVVAAVATVLGARIGVVGDKSRDEIEDYEARFEASIETMPMDSFIESVDAVSDSDAEKFIDKIRQYIDISNASIDVLRKIGRVYTALRRFVEEKKLDAIAVDCFPYLIKSGVAPCPALALLNAEGIPTACEADLSMAILMLISKALTGYTGFIANPSAFEGSRAYLAHCTISLDLAESPVLLPHMESGYPYAITAKFRGDVVTIASLGPDLTTFVVGIGRIVDSGLIYNAMCRTQIVLEMPFDVEKVPIVAPANHHLVIPGDVRRELKAIANLLGLDYSEYSELVAMV